MASQTGGGGGRVKAVEDDTSFQRELIQAGDQLVVVDFYGPRYVFS